MFSLPYARAKGWSDAVVNAVLFVHLIAFGVHDGPAGMEIHEICLGCLAREHVSK